LALSQRKFQHGDSQAKHGKINEAAWGGKIKSVRPRHWGKKKDQCQKKKITSQEKLPPKKASPKEKKATSIEPSGWGGKKTELQLDGVIKKPSGRGVTKR